MKKMTKAIVAVVMSAVMLFTAATGAAAASLTEESTDSFAMATVAQAITTGLNKAATALLDHISDVLPATVKVQGPEAFADYADDNFFAGTEEFIDEAAEGAQWSLGYAAKSILPVDFATGKYYKGGYDINLPLAECADDLKVRLIALDDGSGRGISILAAVDCLGLANADVALIRDALADFAAENNIVSINVSATHVHSGIDTQGIYTDTVGKILTNIVQAFTGGTNLAPAIDNEFRQLIIDKTAECVKSAFESMTTGTMTYATTNAAEYVRDRTTPDIMMEDLYRFMFTPDDGSMGTIITNFGVHPETIGFGTKVGTSDFVYYTEQIINEGGYNFIFLQGAVGTYTEDQGSSSDGLELDRIDATIRYGEELGYILLGMTMTPDERLATLVDEEREAIAKDNEEYTPWYTRETVEERVVAPVLNIAHNEYLAPVDNGVYELLGKLSAANNKMVYDKNGQYYAVTEVGYMEMGDIKLILCPGETRLSLLCRLKSKC